MIVVNVPATLLYVTLTVYTLHFLMLGWCRMQDAIDAMLTLAAERRP